MLADEMVDLLKIPLLQLRNYETVTGPVINALQHLPEAGEIVETLSRRFEVPAMDERRIAKVLARRRSAVDRQVAAVAP